MEEQRQCDCGHQRGSAGHEKERLEIDLLVGTGEDLLDQIRTDKISDEGTGTQNHHVEQPLSTRPDILREELIHKDVDRRKEEGVADAVNDVDGDDQRLDLRHESKDGEANSMAQNADHHGGPPPQSLECRSQNEHGQNFCHLADAHDRRNPVARDSNHVAAEKCTRPVEVTVVNE